MTLPLHPWPPLLAALAASLATPRFGRRLRGAGWIDPARSDRHAARSVPRAGGAAWLLAFGLGTLASLLFAALPVGHPLGAADRAGRALVLSLALAGAGFLLGRLDDLGRVGPGRKWLLQTLLLLAAIGVWCLVGSAAPAPFGGALANAGVTLAWLLVALLVQTALQIFDNLDAALGLVSAAACAVLALRSPSIPFAPSAAVAGAAVLGVLLWNLPPARIYFGNAGSLPLSTVLAFWLASSGIEAGGRNPPELLRSPGAAALLPLLWPLADLAFVSIARWRRGVTPWTGGRDHTTHRLARAVRSDARAAVLLAIYAGAALLVGLSGGPGPR